MQTALERRASRTTEHPLTAEETARLAELSTFDQVVSDYQRDIYRTILAIVRDESLADTLTQDTFVKAWQKRRSFRGSGDLKHWLLRIAVNLTRDEIRRRRRSPLVAFEEDFTHPKDSSPDAERRLISSEIGARIRIELESLSPRQRVVFTLRHYEGHSLESIAKITEMKPATARVHLHRATLRMRKALAVFTRGGRR